LILIETLQLYIPKVRMMLAPYKHFEDENTKMVQFCFQNYQNGTILKIEKSC